jgi:all-trans-nonaprenyl-diphosphate synthase
MAFSTTANHSMMNSINTTSTFRDSSMRGAQRSGNNSCGITHHFHKPHTLTRPCAISSSVDGDDIDRKPRRSAAGPLRVFAPLREALSIGQRLQEATTSSPNGLSLPSALAGEPDSVSLTEIMKPVNKDMDLCRKNLLSVVGERHPLLLAAADQIFSAGGKRLRPLFVFLVARATYPITEMTDITDKHRRLAEITEMIHTASLVHDDVLDDCNIRRGKQTVNSLFGTRVAVLAGDFLFAQSSWFLANLDNMEVIKLISQVIADFADGEISQASSLFDTKITLAKYLDKSFYKTASLVAASCRGAAVFSECPVEVKEAMYAYGKHLGLAFQVVDDILDFTQSTEKLGKPQGQDLASGNLTAPVLFALEDPKVGSKLAGLIKGRFKGGERDLELALQLVQEGGGIERSRVLAREQGAKAAAALDILPDTPAKKSLHLMISYVLDRLY